MRKGWQQRFITHLAQSGNVTRSAEKAGVSRMEAYNERREQPDFALAWDDALEMSADLLEEEARRRAYEGTDKPVYQKGEMVGVIREYSDTLMMFLLKGIRPQKYRENVKQEISGPNEGPVQVDHDASKLRELHADELTRLYREKIRGD